MVPITDSKKNLVITLSKFMESERYKNYIAQLKKKLEENTNYIKKEVLRGKDFSKSEYSVNDSELQIYKWLKEFYNVCDGVSDEFSKEIDDECDSILKRVVDSVEVGQSRDWKVYSKLDHVRFENKFIKYITGEIYSNGVKSKCYVGKRIEEIENSIENEKNNEIIEE